MVYKDKSIIEAGEIWRQALLPEDSTVGQAIRNLDQVSIKIVLVVDKINKLIGTISDGDIRRGLLKGLELNSPITSIVHHNALVVPPELTHDMVRQLMLVNKIQQIPIVDGHQNVVGLYLWDEIATPKTRDNLMVIMAGGKGTRLLPYTEDCPKPMVLVAGKPMLEHIIKRGILAGFNRFVLAIHHMGDVIETYFGNGEWLGIEINYSREESPLGTAGALALLNPKPDRPFVVTNCDVITDIHYGQLLDFHNRYQASATMAVRTHEWQHSFGVVQMQGVEIIGFEEKPVTRSRINAGVYALSPEVLNELIADVPCDMPMLFTRLQAKALRTVAYPMHEPWLDVGRPIDLQAANRSLSIDNKEQGHK
jgi:dTDP-glucose pyrophosphorylase